MRAAIIMIKQGEDTAPPSYFVSIYERGTLLDVWTFNDVVEAVGFARGKDVGVDRIHVFSVTGYPVPLCDLPGVREKFVARIC